jgi:molecular chaperone GrpE
VNEPSDGRAADGARGAGTNEPTVEVPTQDQRMRALQQECQHLDEQLKRALADAANMRRRQRQELEDSRHRIVEGIAQELLPVLDGFRLALHTWDGRSDHIDPTTLVDGVRLVQTLLRASLERHGLQEIAAEGRPFDPTRHEAVAVEVRPGTPAGQVLAVLQPGFLLGDRVLRHAKVLVSGARDQGAAAGGQGEPDSES